MPITIIVPVAAIQGARQQLAAVRSFVGSPEPLLKVWGIEVLKDIDQTFREGGRPKWPALRPNTLAAKRQGKRASAGPLPLQGIRHTFDAQTEPDRVTVLSTSPVAGFHEDGTRGPYPIEARNAKALAIPVGAQSFAGLGRSRATGSGAFIGRGATGRFKGRQGQAIQPFKGLIFRKRVMHPGLPPRRMLPSLERIIPRLQLAASAFLTRLLATKRVA